MFSLSLSLSMLPPLLSCNQSAGFSSSWCPPPQKKEVKIIQKRSHCYPTGRRKAPFGREKKVNENKRGVHRRVESKQQRNNHHNVPPPSTAPPPAPCTASSVRMFHFNKGGKTKSTHKPRNEPEVALRQAAPPALSSSHGLPPRDAQLRSRDDRQGRRSAMRNAAAHVRVAAA